MGDPGATGRREGRPFKVVPLHVPVAAHKASHVKVEANFGVIGGRLVYPGLLSVPGRDHAFTLLRSTALPMRRHAETRLFLCVHL